MRIVAWALRITVVILVIWTFIDPRAFPWWLVLPGILVLAIDATVRFALAVDKTNKSQRRP